MLRWLHAVHYDDFLADALRVVVVLRFAAFLVVRFFAARLPRFGAAARSASKVSACSSVASVAELPRFARFPAVYVFRDVRGFVSQET